MTQGAQNCRQCGAALSADETRGLVKRFENRHRRHRRAVRVRDDAFGEMYTAHITIEVDFTDYQWNLWILAPRRGVAATGAAGLQPAPGVGSQGGWQPGRYRHAGGR